MRVTDCECPFASGYCPRHQVDKNETLVKLCKSKPSYWYAWENGRGPGQRKPRDHNAKARRERVAEGAALQRRIVSWLTHFAHEDDVGVGDVYSRMLALSGNRDIAEVLKRFGAMYSCCGKEASSNLNERYPFEKNQTSSE